MTFNQFIGRIASYKEASVDFGRFLDIAKREFKDMVGMGIDTWNDFLSQPEVGLTVREANSLIRLARYVDATGVSVPDINFATLKFAAEKAIVGPELVEDMKVLSLKDFKDRYYDFKTKETGGRTYKYMVMKVCNETGNMTKVHGVESEVIEENFKDKIYG